MAEALRKRIFWMTLSLCIGIPLIQAYLLVISLSPWYTMFIPIVTICGGVFSTGLVKSVLADARRYQNECWLDAVEHRDADRLEDDEMRRALLGLWVKENMADADPFVPEEEEDATAPVAEDEIVPLAVQAQATLAAAIAHTPRFAAQANAATADDEGDATFAPSSPAHEVVLPDQYADELTGLGNRLAFRTDMVNFLQGDGSEGQGLLVLIRATELDKVNKLRGYSEGDSYLNGIAHMINSVAGHYEHASLYRIAGGDFALMINPADDVVPHLFGQALKDAFDEFQALNELDSAAYSGIVSVSAGEKIESVLSRADLALARAQTQSSNSWALQQEDALGDMQGQQHWQVVLKEVLTNKRINLSSQVIEPQKADAVTYNEIYARFYSNDGSLLPTSTLFAIAQRLDMLTRLEQLVITHIIEQYRKLGRGKRWGINLSANILQNSSLLIWLDRELQSDPTTAANLVFELREDQLAQHLGSAKRVFEILRRNGARTTVSHFGNGTSSLTLLRDLRPNYVKLSNELLGGLDKDQNGKQLVRMLIDVAHRMDCLVIAEGIEQVAQKQLLIEMQVDALQGFAIGKPYPL
ncbi:MAG: EAL domain-containing protein [Aeromonas sp.]